MKDNTQIDDEENKLKFVKLQMPATIMDFLADHYGFFDLVELNQMSLYILKALAIMEKDGFKLAIHKIVDGKSESYQVDIHEIIAKLRIELANSMNEKKPHDPDIKIEEKETGVKI